jgi:rhodanese-related sulfurtransferase
MSKNPKAKTNLIVLIALFTCSVGAFGPNTLWAAEFDHITQDALKKMIENGEKGFLVVDVQPQGAYRLGHIKGAINFPWQPDLKSSGNLPKDKMLVLYCDCAHEEDSIDTATQLMEKWDYTNIKLLQGGWSGWMNLGYPVEK